MKRIVWTKQEALARMLAGDLVYYYAEEGSFIPERTAETYYRKDENGKMLQMNILYRKSKGEYVFLMSAQDLKLRDRNSKFYSVPISKGSVFADEIENDPTIKTIGEY
jgi:hypothetical protein